MRLTIAFKLLLCMILTSMTCKKKNESDHCHFKNYFWNDSNRPVYFSIMPGYPDTTLKDFYYNPALAPTRYKVLPGNRSYESLTGDCIENLFIYTPRPEKIMVFVFDADVMESNSWETIRQNYMVLKRYELSLRDLENMGWQISYH